MRWPTKAWNAPWGDFDLQSLANRYFHDASITLGLQYSDLATVFATQGAAHSTAIAPFFSFFCFSGRRDAGAHHRDRSTMTSCPIFGAKPWPRPKRPKTVRRTDRRMTSLQALWQ
jgi:hypothetical protein